MGMRTLAPCGVQTFLEKNKLTGNWKSSPLAIGNVRPKKITVKGNKDRTAVYMLRVGSHSEVD